MSEKDRPIPTVAAPDPTKTTAPRKPIASQPWAKALVANLNRNVRKKTLTP